MLFLFTKINESGNIYKDYNNHRILGFKGLSVRARILPDSYLRESLAGPHVEL